MQRVSLPMMSSMSVEGIQAVQARISQIEARFGVTAPARTSTSGRASSPLGAASFDDVFASTVAGRSGLATPTSPDAAGSAVATVRAPGGYGPIVPPAELSAFGNGRIPTDRLVPIGDGTERLYGPAAEAFKRMASDAWSAGVDLKVNDGYRSLPEQEALAAQVGLFRDGGRAAAPGTSTHGWGLSVDVDTDGGGTDWLRANAARYGFVEDVPREPWHWTFRPGS